MTRTVYCLCLMLLLASLAVAQTYTITDLGVLSGDVSTQGRGISPGGHIWTHPVCKGLVESDV
jgi:hypothetical protein